MTDVTPGGHPPEHWEPVLAAAPVLPADELRRRVAGPGHPTLLVLGAHPDDETLGCGRLVSWWSRYVGPVLAVVATAGEACVDHVGPRPPGLAERRLAEWRDALELLGAAPNGCLGVADGQVAAAETAVAGALSERVDDLPRRTGVVLAAPWVGDPHPDHQAVGRAARTVAAAADLSLLAYPVWLTYWGEPAEHPELTGELRRVEVDPAAEEAHAAAWRCFTSQLAPLRPELGPVVPAAMLAHQRQQLVVVERVGGRR